MSQTPPSERSHLPVAPPYTNHGHTVASWATVVLVILGGLLATFAVVLTTPWLGWVGGGVIVAGLLVGRVLRMLGMGQPPLGSDASAAAGEAGGAR
jgi:hypothetical protein